MSKVETAAAGVGKTIATVAGIAWGLVSLWITIVLATGGSLSFFGVRVHGNLVLAALWFIVGIPVTETVLWWVVLLVTSPFAAASAIAHNRQVGTGPGGSTAEVRLPTLAARGVWMPVVNHASGGPGTFTIEAGQPIFATDGGIVHDYGWGSYASWSAAPSGQIFVNMSPGVGARMRFEPTDAEAWRTVFSENGLQELARG